MGRSPGRMSLYDKYGGFATVSSLVHAFYDRCLESALLAPYFRGVDMERLMGHQTNFLCKVLGGPDNYDGRALAAAHRGLDIDDAAFDEVARCLSEVLTEASVEAADIEAIMTVVGSTRADVTAAA